jgi:hypothetical protein
LKEHDVLLADLTRNIPDVELRNNIAGVHMSLVANIGDELEKPE